MNRSLAFLLIGLLFGGTAGFVAAAGYGVTLDGHDHGEHAHGEHAHGGHDDQTMSHSHDERLEVTGDAAPTLDIAVSADPATGWNLHLMTTNFRFAPENASGDHVAGEGHGHLYINGEKIARLYGPWAHIPALPAGEHLIEVTLNANDHRALAVEGAPVSAQTMLKVE